MRYADDIRLRSHMEFDHNDLCHFHKLWNDLKLQREGTNINNAPRKFGGFARKTRSLILLPQPRASWLTR